MNKHFRTFLFLYTFYSAVSCAHAQVISTIAGNGTMGFSGDGGPAVLAELYLPNGIVADSAGSVYVATSDLRVRKISTAGIITTFAGNGTGVYTDGVPATATGISGSVCIKFDRNWNLYIGGYSRILKVNTAGIITTVAGTGIAGYSGDGGPATVAQIEASSLALDTSGNVYFSYGTTNRIRKVNTAGIITTIAGTGVAGYSGDGGPATAAQLNGPCPGFVDRYGSLYFCDGLNHCVRKIDVSGIINTIAGTGVSGYSGDGGPATAAQLQLDQGNDVEGDTAGNIYITDAGVPANNCIRKILPSGVITTFIGDPSHDGYAGDGGPATAAFVSGPGHIARYKNGPIYISDRQNNVIRMISAAPYFLHGRYQAATVCSGFVFSLDTLLAADDSTAGLTEHWSLISGPHHGSASVAYAATTTGSVIYPTGLTYTSSGYTGLDTIQVRITDSIVSDTTTIYINVITAPVVGAITGLDTVCIRDSIRLTDTTAGGLWSTSNGNATVTAGTVKGITAGVDTIRYVVMNICGMDTVRHIVTVKRCPSSVTTVAAPGSELMVYPNPAEGTFTCMLSSSYDEAVHITITNTVGQKVKDIIMATNRSTAITPDTPPGVYFINAVTAHGVWSGKLVVK